MAEDLAELGWALAREGDVEQAREMFQRAIDAGDARGHQGLGNLHEHAGETDAARQHYAHAVAAGVPGSWTDLAILAQDVADAEQILRAGAAAGDDWAYASLGEMLGDQDRNEEAEAVFREALAHGHTRVWLVYGNLLAELDGREDDAEAAYRAAIAHDDGDAHLNLANLLADRDRPEEAEEEYRRALQRDDELARVPYGELLLELGRREEAIAQLEAAAAAGDPDAVELLDEAGAGG